MAKAAVQRNAVFISYSHHDSEYLEELQLHLKPLERYTDVFWWADTRIEAGLQWRDEIRDAIGRARVAILLVSPHFLASDFIAENELPPLLEAAERELATVLPVVLKPCLFSRIDELARYQSVNAPSQPLADLDEVRRSKVWVALVERLIDILVEGKLTLKRMGRPAAHAGALRQQEAPREHLPPPDLELIVTTEMSGSNRRLLFNVNAADPRLEIQYKNFGPRQVRPDLEVFIDRRSDELARSSRTVEALQLRLEAIGTQLALDLLPDDLRHLLEQLDLKRGTFLIRSLEPWIPWELLTLQRPVGDEPVRPAFLGEAFSVTRWPLGVPQVGSLRLRRIGVVSPEDGRELGREQEVSFLLGLPSEVRRVDRIPARYVPLMEALAKGEHDCWHLATYGDDRRPTMMLEGREALTPEDLLLAAPGFRKTRPLVFLSGPTIRCWAVPLLEAGAGAVVGSYFPQSSEFTDHLVRAFYPHLLSGMAIGRAVLETRLQVRSQNDPSWLWFAAFAHPNAACKESK